MIADRERENLEKATKAGMQGIYLDSEDGSLPFSDGHFDVVFCNSVIEHVTGRKTETSRFGPDWHRRARSAQQAFASEIRRIGRRYFVQTPHRGFPLDQHVWLPFTHWLPRRAQRRLVRVTDTYWVKYCGVVDWLLLGVAEMRELFPDAEVVVERWSGLPKSVIAYR